MKKIPLFSFCIVASSFLSLNTYAQHIPGYAKLFTLERTLNKNQVVYEANVAEEDYPINPYWIMLAQNGHQEGLTRMERNRAYGVEVTDQVNDEVTFVVKAFKTHPIVVRTDPTTKLPYAVITLGGSAKILKNIYLTLGGGLIPSVRKIDLTYQDVLSGPLKKQTIIP